MAYRHRTYQFPDPINVLEPEFRGIFAEHVISTDVPAGWKSLVKTALELITYHVERGNNSEFKIKQVKEKFGGLRIYAESSDKFIDGVIAMASAISDKTCQSTGVPGTKRVINGVLIAVLSDAEAAKAIALGDEVETATGY